jgi:hypothetical protein
VPVLYMAAVYAGINGLQKPLLLTRASHTATDLPYHPVCKSSYIWDGEGPASHCRAASARHSPASYTCLGGPQDCLHGPPVLPLPLCLRSQLPHLCSSYDPPPPAPSAVLTVYITVRLHRSVRC